MQSLNHKIVMWCSSDGCEVREQWSMEQFERYLQARPAQPAMAHSYQKMMLVEIQAPLRVVAVVCFTLPMDAKGSVRESWMLPLEHILSMGESVVVPGYGPILVAALGCPSVSWHAHSLWRPTSGSQTEGTFVALKKAVDENPLGLPIYSDVNDTFNSLVLESNKSLSRMFASFDDTVAIHNMAPQEVDDLWRIKFQSSQQKMIDLVKSLTYKYQQLLRNERAENKHLQTQLEHLMNANDSDDLLQPADSARPNPSAALYKVANWMRRFIREERSHKPQLSSSMTIVKMAQDIAHAGIELVSHQPGIGKVVIPPEHLEIYLENPAAYLAASCRVSETTYRNWLAHFNMPVCKSINGGEVCGIALEPCESPADFVSGITDHCARHHVLVRDQTEQRLSSVV